MPTETWNRRAELYKRFAPAGCDFSPTAAEALFLYESKGLGPKPIDGGDGVFQGAAVNGYAAGKRWLDWQVEQWARQLWSLEVPVAELYADLGFSWEFLDSTLPEYFVQQFHRTEPSDSVTYRWCLNAAPMMNRLRRIARCIASKMAWRIPKCYDRRIA